MPAGRLTNETDAAELLRASGLRRTSVRVGVLEVLSDAPSPMDVPAIIASLKGDVDAVTVYRTLNTFIAKKLVNRLRGDDRSWRYEIGGAHSTASHGHPHFVCESCGSVTCLRDANIPTTLVKSLAVDGDYRVTHAEVVLHGTCPPCAKPGRGRRAR